MDKKKILDIIKNLAAIIIISIIIFFFSKNIYSNWEKIKNFSWSPNYYYLFIATFIEISVQFLSVLVWKYLLKILGSNISYKKGLKIWFVSSLGRYLPGKAWQLAGMMYLLKREGVKIEISVAASIFVQIFSLIPGIFIGLTSLLLLISNINTFYIIAIIILSVSLIIFFSQKKYIGKLALYLARKKGKEISIVGFKPQHSLLFLFIYIFYWIFRGLAFFFFIRSWHYLPVKFIYPSISLFAASYVGGLLFLLVPGGIGVREGIMKTLIEKTINYNNIKIISSPIVIINRIWLSIIEILCLLIALILNWRNNGKEEKNNRE